jgi:hypothetical protein
MSDVLAPETHVIPSFDRESVRAEIRSMTTDALRTALVSGLRLSVFHLLRTALIYQELEERGEKVEGVSDGLLTILGRIARGDLLAEVVVRFAGSPSVMARVGRMPVEEQRAVVGDDDRVKDLLRPRPRKTVRQGVLHKERRQSPLKSDTRSDIEQRHPLLIAERATVKDLAELIVGMAGRHPEPQAVWAAVDTLRKRSQGRTG